MSWKAKGRRRAPTDLPERRNVKVDGMTPMREGRSHPFHRLTWV